MEWVETTGRTISEAKDRALDQLGVDEHDAEFEVLDEGKTGLFGRVKTEARVRARVRPTSPRPKDGEGRRRRGDGRRERQPAARPNESRQSESRRDEKVSAEIAETKAPKSPTKRRAKSKGRVVAPAASEEGASKMDDQVALSEQGEVARSFLTGLFGELDASVSIDVGIQEDDEIVTLSVNGENLGHFIGPRGTTLHSLQEVTRTVVQRKTGARSGRILVDVAHYREKRREALARFSRQVADEVLQTGEQRVLEPMNPGDRKVVHDTVNAIEGVATTSEGEEPRRRVIIRPAESA